MASNLSSPDCHFTWDFANRTRKNRFLRNRIRTIKDELKSQEVYVKKRNGPQLYSVQGFLNVLLYRNDSQEDDDQYLENAESCFDQALKECNRVSNEEEASGYRLVIYGNFIHLNELRPNANVKEYQDAYNDLIRQGFADHPSVLAMKGFTASYLDLPQEAIMWYEKALETEQDVEKAEWLFGLALAKLQSDYRRSKPALNEEIQDLLRQAIALDPTYDMAKIKLARCWLDRHRRSNQSDANLDVVLTAQINDLIGPILANGVDKIELSVLEEIASLYNRIDRYRDEGIQLLNKCRKRNPESKKTLAGLANSYFKRWKNNREESDLKKSVKFFDKIVSDLENAKMFDITKLGVVHLSAFKFFLGEDGAKARNHKLEWENCFKKVKHQLEQGQLEPKEEIEMCHSLALFYEDMHKPAKEEKYWRKVLDINAKALEEGTGDFRESSYVKKAEEKLSEFGREFRPKL